MRVVVVDDQQLMRRGLTMLLSIEPDVEVVGEAGDGRAGVAAVREAGPDVVLSDARMPVMGGVELVAELARDRSGPPVIILSTFDDDELVRSAIGAGASGFMLKDSSTDDLVHAMRAVIGGGIVIDPRVARAAINAGRPGKEPQVANPLTVLTPAERAVAERVATGATNAKIAADLVITEGTVKNHVTALLRKLGQRDRTSLALLLSRYLGD